MTAGCQCRARAFATTGCGALRGRARGIAVRTTAAAPARASPPAWLLRCGATRYHGRIRPPASGLIRERHRDQASYRPGSPICGGCRSGKELLVVCLRTEQEPAILRWFAQADRPAADQVCRGAQRAAVVLRLQAKRGCSLVRRFASQVDAGNLSPAEGCESPPPQRAVHDYRPAQFSTPVVAINGFARPRWAGWSNPLSHGVALPR